VNETTESNAETRKWLRMCAVVLVTSAVTGVAMFSQDKKTCIGMVLFWYPMTAFVLVPIHFRLQIPKESDVVAAFATWLVSGVLAFAFRWLFP
jgi:FtsH-binding integral membrane protein